MSVLSVYYTRVIIKTAGVALAWSSSSVSRRSYTRSPRAVFAHSLTRASSSVKVIKVVYV